MNQLFEIGLMLIFRSFFEETIFFFLFSLFVKEAKRTGLMVAAFNLKTYWRNFAVVHV